MSKKQAFFFVLLSCVCLVVLCGCAKNNKTQEKTELNFAFQYGMAYAPLQVMKEQGLIEKHYGKPLTVNWQQLNSGAAINEGILSGSLDLGGLGIPPAIVGITRGIPYKIFGAFSAQPQALMTNDPDIHSLKDVTGEHKIALVNISSIQHILLSMAAQEELGNPHALDTNILAMTNPDGMTALIAGSVDLHLTSSPYSFKEEEAGMTKISSLENVWPEGNPYIIGVASQKLHDDHPEMYQAVVDALQEAIDFLNENPEAAAEMLCENEGVTADVMLSWLNDPGCVYTTETKDLMKMAEFMADAGFIETKPEQFSDLVFDNVRGN